MSSTENLLWWSVFSAARSAGLSSEKARRMGIEAVNCERVTKLAIIE